MGYWGYKIFENDVACDTLEDIIESEDAILAINEILDDCLNEDYLDSDIASSALVAVAIIDKVVNNTDYNWGNDEFQEWIDENRDLKLINLKDDIYKIIEKVLSDDSELKELWEESEYYEEWRNYLINIKKSIKF